MELVNRIRSLWRPNGHVVTLPLVRPEPTFPATALEERQQLLAHHVRLVARGMSNGLCVYGSRGGLGKTKVVLDTLRSEGVNPVVLTGHCTPLSLYTALYEHPDAVIFLDDVDGMFRNLPALGILRAALWGQNNEQRLVTYNSSQLKIPSHFFFTGRIIFAINTLPKKNHAFQAVLSRVDQFELDASNDEVLEMMKGLACEGYSDKLSAAECLEVVNFIAGFAATRELSLRLLEPSYQKILYSKEAGCDWRDLVRSQLEQIGHQDISPADKMFELDGLRQVLRDYPDSVGDQVETWCRLTKRSRATFFRLKAKLHQGEHHE